jgi:tripartite-type tricarboxylate transporter receptor subunit TctC
MVGRVLIERMRTSLGQPLVMENVAGANGTIAAARVARASPDGYTLILGSWNSQVGASAVYPVPYDVLADFEPIALATISRLWLVGKTAFPPNNIAELIEWMKANPGKRLLQLSGKVAPVTSAGYISRMRRLRSFSSYSIALAPRHTRTLWQATST